jgi:hypothetical protein
LSRRDGLSLGLRRNPVEELSHSVELKSTQAATGISRQPVSPPVEGARITSRKVLITGAAGGTGRATVREATAIGLEVRAIVRKIDERFEELAGRLSCRSGLLTTTANFAQAAKEVQIQERPLLAPSSRTGDRTQTRASGPGCVKTLVELES